MAKIIREEWDIEKHFSTFYLQLEEEQEKVICELCSKTKLKVYFDLEKKQKYSMHTIADCIETIRDSYMKASGCSTIEFEFNGQKIEVKDGFGAPSSLEQMAKIVDFK